MDIYREIILDHYKHPRNFGHLDEYDVKIDDKNVACGDAISMELRIVQDRVIDIRFSGQGCVISQASASLLTEHVMGWSVSDIMSLSKDDVLVLLGIDLTPSRVKCAMLPLEVLQKAVVVYANR